MGELNVVDVKIDSNRKISDKHQPIVEFGLVDGYDNPQVIQCRTVEADVGHRNTRSCKGQFCIFWERCCMPNRVIILGDF